MVAGRVLGEEGAAGRIGGPRRLDRRALQRDVDVRLRTARGVLDGDRQAALVGAERVRGRGDHARERHGADVDRRGRRDGRGDLHAVGRARRGAARGRGPARDPARAAGDRVRDVVDLLVGPRVGALLLDRGELRERQRAHDSISRCAIEAETARAFSSPETLFATSKVVKTAITITASSAAATIVSRRANPSSCWCLGGAGMLRRRIGAPGLEELLSARADQRGTDLIAGMLQQDLEPFGHRRLIIDREHAFLAFDAHAPTECRERAQSVNTLMDSAMVIATYRKA